MNIVHLDSSITGEASVSRQLSAAIVAQLKATNPKAKVTYHDLVANPLPHLTLAEFGTPQSIAMLEEFKAADVVVIGAPMYNFGISTQLKAWIDRISVAGQTFKYTATGPVGLMGGKRVIIAASSGGIYNPQSPMAAFNHQAVYLQHAMAFMGVTDVEIIRAEGVAMGDEPKAATMASAGAAIAQLAA